MDLSLHFQSDHLHHAYLCIGSVRHVGESIYNFFTEDPVWSSKGYTIERFSYARMNMEDAQMVKSSIGIDRYVKRIIIIEASFVNHEAQQSLLKTIEEPSVGICFVWCVPRATTLLPTIRSRCYEIFFQPHSDSQKSNDSSESLANPVNFLAASYEVRQAWIKEETEDWESNQVLEFITMLAEWLHTHIAEHRESTIDFSEFTEASKCLRTAFEYIHSPSANHRMLLESLAFAFPIKKV